MTLKRAFAIPFLLAAAAEVVAFFVHYDSMIGWGIHIGQHFMIAVAGYLIVRAGGSIGLVMKCVLSFVLLWLLIGINNYLIGSGDAPTGWTQEQEQQALLGYLLAWCMFLPVAFVFGFMGWFGARLFPQVQP